MFWGFKDLTCSQHKLKQILILYKPQLLIYKIETWCPALHRITVNVKWYTVIDGLRQWLAQRNKSICVTDYSVILVITLSLAKISHYHMLQFCKRYLLKSNALVMEIKSSNPRVLSPRIFQICHKVAPNTYPSWLCTHGKLIKQKEDTAANNPW